MEGEGKLLNHDDDDEDEGHKNTNQKEEKYLRRDHWKYQSNLYEKLES
jgi:hypothetical protein